MRKFVLYYNDFGNMSEKELKKIHEFSLIDCDVRIQTLAENKDGQAVSHLICVPSVFLKGIDKLECTLKYPLNEKHTFQIAIDKVDFGKMYLLDADALLLAIANEYKMLWNEHKDLFWGHSWEDLWIEELILKGNTLELHVGS